MQMLIVKDKWEPINRSSPFRTYLYNYVGEEQSPFFQPGPDDDENKWEEALRERPNAGYVPVLVKGFWELGKRAQRQKDFLTIMQIRLHEINKCLTDLLSRHDLKISVKIADCRRKHLVLSQRCLSLAAKTQVLRNRGYAMDDAEEELKKKLVQLERAVFDPSITGRAEEIWARMLAIREHSKRLQAEIERAGPAAATEADEALDESVLKTAKKVQHGYPPPKRPKRGSILMKANNEHRSWRITLLRSSIYTRSWRRFGRILKNSRSLLAQPVIKKKKLEVMV